MERTVRKTETYSMNKAHMQDVLLKYLYDQGANIDEADTFSFDMDSGGCSVTLFFNSTNEEY